MQPRERVPYSAIVDRPPLKPPGRPRVVAWTILNTDVWDLRQPSPRRGLPKRA